MPTFTDNTRLRTSGATGTHPDAGPRLLLPLMAAAALIALFGEWPRNHAGDLGF